jgi:hypothetical protein
MSAFGGKADIDSDVLTFRKGKAERQFNTAVIAFSPLASAGPTNILSRYGRTIG